MTSKSKARFSIRKSEWTDTESEDQGRVAVLAGDELEQTGG